MCFGSSQKKSGTQVNLVHMGHEHIVQNHVDSEISVRRRKPSSQNLKQRCFSQVFFSFFLRDLFVQDLSAGHHA